MMKSDLKRWLPIAVLLATTGGLSAQGSRDALLVDTDWLMEHREDPGLVVLHIAGNADQALEDAIIPGSGVLHSGAISISSDEPRIRLDLPEDLSSVRAAFEGAGVSDGSRIVLTYPGRSFPNATRAMWTLQVLGIAENVSILDGGVEAWQAAGGATTTDRVEVRAGQISAPVDLGRRVDAAWVLENGQANGIALIDARRTASYDGSRPELPGRVGHIPGAGSLPQVDLYTTEGLLRPERELRDLFERAGLEQGDRVVAYCHIGYWASAVVFAARTLGIDARLYDGSMTEWAADSNLPLTTEGAGGR